MDFSLFENLEFRGWIGLGFAIPVAIVGMAIVAALYTYEAGRLPIAPRIALATLRMAIVAAVSFLLLRPVWVLEEQRSQKRPISVLIDTSLSMAGKDPRPNIEDQWRSAIAFGLVPADKKPPAMPTSADIPSNLPVNPSRIEIARAAIMNLRLLDRLRDVGPLDLAVFEGRREVKSANDLSWIKDLQATGSATAMAGSAWELLDRDSNDQPAAIVYVTDGRENGDRFSLADLAAKCKDNSVPLYIYGVGSSQFGHVQIRDIAIPEALFVEDTVSIPVRYRVRGIKQGKAVVTLKLRHGHDESTDQEVARSPEREVQEGDDLREIIGFVPTIADAAKKDLELIASVSVSGATETVADSIVRSVRIEQRKIKVLMIDYYARWDFKFLQRDLVRDRRVDARFFLVDADRAAMKTGEPWIESFPQTQQELNKYDLLILGDLPGDFLTDVHRKQIRDFVAEGGGLIHIAGRLNGEVPFVSKELEGVLPVEIPSRRFKDELPAVPAGFRPQLTAQGVRSPMLALEDDPIDNVRVWKTLPEMFWHYPVTKLRPGAEALLVHPKATMPDRKPMPMLASHYFGKGYVLFLGFDETWRWRFNEAETYFGRFWSQAVYIAGSGRTSGTRLTQLSIDTTEPVLNKSGQIYAHLLTKDFKPLTSEKLLAKIVRLDSTIQGGEAEVGEIELKPVPGQVGDYVATVPFNQEGRFALKVDNSGDKAQLEYRVNLPPTHEKAPGGMAEAELVKLASDTGGKFYREEDLYNLPTDVQPKSTPRVTKDEILLWNRWAMFLLIGLLTMEWFLRKFNSMS